MADLSELQTSLPVKIVGADSLGIETTPVKASDNGDLGVSDISNDAGVNGAVTVGTSAVEARVGGSPLINRKTLTVHNNSNTTIYWGYSSGVTTANGTPLEKAQFIAWEIGPDLSVYLIAASGSNNVRVTESA